MNTLVMCYIWLLVKVRARVTLTLIIIMIIQHCRRIITHYMYVCNASQMDALNKLLPKLVLVANVRPSSVTVASMAWHTAGDFCTEHAPGLNRTNTTCTAIYVTSQSVAKLTPVHGAAKSS